MLRTTATKATGLHLIVSPSVKNSQLVDDRLTKGKIQIKDFFPKILHTCQEMGEAHYCTV